MKTIHPICSILVLGILFCHPMADVAKSDEMPGSKPGSKTESATDGDKEKPGEKVSGRKELENFNRPTLLTVRELLFLKKEVAISNVERGEAGMYRELPEEQPNAEEEKGLNAEDLEDLRRERSKIRDYPPREFCYYFKFECDLTMQEMLGAAAVLQGSEIDRIEMQVNILDGLWVVPQFPAEVLRERDGISAAWHRGNGLFRLFMTSLPSKEGSGGRFTYYGACEIGSLPTSGTYPSLGLDRDGNVLKPGS